jgi:hypothetical protein
VVGTDPSCPIPECQNRAVPALVTAASSYVPRDHDQPELSGDGLLLRPWRASDTDALLAAFADPAIQQWHRLRLDDDGEAHDWVRQAHQR